MPKLPPNTLLRQEREKRGWSQRHLADLLGSNSDTVRYWESGRRGPSPFYQRRLCEVFDLPPEQLGLPSTTVQTSPLLSTEELSPSTSPLTLEPQELPVPAAPFSGIHLDQVKQWLLGQGIDENRRAMLLLMRNRVKERLQRSLQQATFIVLGMAEVPGALAHPWHFALQEEDAFTRLLPEQTLIIDLYEHAEHELLILGEPGAGKSTLLLELARSLLNRAEQNEYAPLPVIFNLSTWAVKQPPLAEWMIEELRSHYHVPRKIAREWVETNRLAILLDGLDETAEEARAACVRVINEYQREHAPVPLVVCCRHKEYFAQATRVHLQLAVLIQPLTEKQIDGYLTSAGDQLVTVRQAIQEDHGLQEMCTNPLMLSIIALTYWGEKTPLTFTGTLEDRRKHILHLYVQRMLERRSAQPYSPQQTMHWLSWLAQQMKSHSLTELYLERMQPDWLPDHHLYRRYRLSIIRWIFALICIVSAGSFACFRGDSFPNEPGLFYWLGGGKGSTILEWMAPGLGGGLRGAASFGIILVTVTVLAMVLGRRGGIPTITRQAMRHSLLKGLRHGVVIGIVVGIFAALVFWHFIDWRSGLLFGGGISLFGGLIVGLMSALITLLQYESDPPDALSPSQPVQSWRLRDRLVSASLFALCAAMSFAFCYAAQSKGMNQYVLIYGLIVGFFFGLVYGLGNGTDLIGGLGVTIRPAEMVAWSWQAVRQNAKTNLLKGGGLGFTIMICVSCVVACISSGFYGLAYGLRYGLVYGIIVGLIAGIVGTLTGVLTSGWSSNLLEAEQHFARPNEGIRRSLRNAAFAACLFGPLGGVASGLGCGLAFGLVGGLHAWLILGGGVAIILTVTFALQFLLLYGGSAYLEHYILRWYLWRKGLMPWKYSAFLDYAAEHILLRKVSGGYMFIHRLLLEHFAALDEASYVQERQSEKEQRCA